METTVGLPPQYERVPYLPALLLVFYFSESVSREGRNAPTSEWSGQGLEASCRTIQRYSRSLSAGEGGRPKVVKALGRAAYLWQSRSNNENLLTELLLPERSYLGMCERTPRMGIML